MALTLDGITGVSTTGNLLAAGNVSVSGNIYFGNAIANLTINNNLSIAGNVVATGFYASNVVPGISAVGNIIGGNARTGAGTLTTGNIINNNTSGVGNIGTTANPFNYAFIQSTSAWYADLAEMYQADANYVPGTVLTHGGAKEVTISNSSHTTNIAGVVSTNPSYLMNNGLSGETDVKLALVGRVPCQVVGIIHKGDSLVASHIPGVATCLDPTQYQLGCVIGKAVEEYNSDQPGVIEVAVGSF